MAVATGVQQVRVFALGDDVNSATETAQMANKIKDQLLGQKESAEKQLAEIKFNAEAGAKRADKTIADLEIKTKDIQADLDYERGRNQALEKTISTMADKICPSPKRR